MQLATRMMPVAPYTCGRRFAPALASMAALCLGAGQSAIADSEAPPNFVIIFVDDLGFADIEPFGNRYMILIDKRIGPATPKENHRQNAKKAVIFDDSESPHFPTLVSVLASLAFFKMT